MSYNCVMLIFGFYYLITSYIVQSFPFPIVSIIKPNCILIPSKQLQYSIVHSPILSLARYGIPAQLWLHHLDGIWATQMVVELSIILWSW